MNPKVKREITVAVLPFRILSKQQDLSPVILGFAEDLITNFSKFVGLSIVSPYSSLLVNDPTDTKSIMKLGADYIVSGSFRTFNNDVRITIQLVKPPELKVIFAKNYNEKFDNLLHTLDEITQQIVSILQQQIDYDILSFSYKRDKVELAAYESWLVGMSHLKKATLENDIIARSYFETALKINPNYARAYSGLSLSYFNEWSCQLWNQWDISQKGAHKYALLALEHDENDYISLTVLGKTYLYLREFDKAEHCLRKSIRMNPNNADNLVQVAFSLMFLGYAEESEKLYLKANQLNPLHQDLFYPYASNIYFEMGDYQKCLELGKRVEPDKLWIDFQVYLAAAYYYIGDMNNMQLQWKNFLKQFETFIGREEGDIEEQALQWHINVNPYKLSTKLEEYRQFMLSHLGLKDFSIAKEENKPEQASFLKKGELWEVLYKGEQVLLKDNKGNRDIVKLLGEPKKEFLCTELMESSLDDFSSNASIDQKAKSNYQKRIRDLQQEIEEAEQSNNPEVLRTLREEYEQLLDYLSKSLGLTGKTRELGSTMEKARSAVTWRIRSSIKKIEGIHPKLASHLANSIKTGSFCSYRPEEKVKWLT